MNASLQNVYKEFLVSKGASTDTRELKPGMAFFALRGEKFNGNDFVRDALDKGALFAISDDPALAGEDKVFQVDSVLEALQELASFHRKAHPWPMIAITGSNGKTTTKEILVKVLDQKYRVSFTPGNLNNHIGMPLAMLNMPAGSQMVVVEMGANHQGEIAHLCSIADPDYGIITNIGKAHLEGFGGLAGVIAAKTELYNHIRKKGGKVFVNADNPLLMELSDGIDRVTYSTGGNADYPTFLDREEPTVKVRAAYGAMEFDVVSNLYGSYNHENIAAAVCMGLYFDVRPEDIGEAVKQYRPENMRSQLLFTKHNKIYLDAYNANPTSMMNAVSFFAGLNEQPKMLILGDMLELGHSTVQEHREIIGKVRQLKFDIVILAGKNFMKAGSGDDLHVFPDAESARLWLRQRSFEGYSILVKGSRGIGIEKVLDEL